MDPLPLPPPLATTNANTTHVNSSSSSSSSNNNSTTTTTTTTTTAAAAAGSRISAPQMDERSSKSLSVRSLSPQGHGNSSLQEQHIPSSYPRHANSRSLSPLRSTSMIKNDSSHSGITDIHNSSTTITNNHNNSSLNASISSSTASAIIDHEYIKSVSSVRSAASSHERSSPVDELSLSPKKKQSFFNKLLRFPSSILNSGSGGASNSNLSAITNPYSANSDSSQFVRKSVERPISAKFISSAEDLDGHLFDALDFSSLPTHDKVTLALADLEFEDDDDNDEIPNDEDNTSLAKQGSMDSSTYRVRKLTHIPSTISLGREARLRAGSFIPKARESTVVNSNLTKQLYSKTRANVRTTDTIVSPTSSTTGSPTSASEILPTLNVIPPSLASNTSSSSSVPVAMSENLLVTTKLPFELLPRGGAYVDAGNGVRVQLGIPPETIKDVLSAGFSLPTAYVVPRERFHRTIGINLTEIEFPAFYNFFILHRPVTLITHADWVPHLKIILKEALDGPKKHQFYLSEEYSPYASTEFKQSLPDFRKEIAYFREPRPPNFDAIEVESLVKFLLFDDETMECTIPGTQVTVRDVGDGFLVKNHETEDFVIIPDDMVESVGGKRKSKGSNNPSIKSLPRSRFAIPNFGVTVLGNSHGFDREGSTSGFVVWINGNGVMVDPPPYSHEMLDRFGIPLKSISAIILTHCHADHDAGTFQKLIKEGKITLLTTKTIFESFLRKYSAVADLHVEFLRQLVTFRPVLLDEPCYLFSTPIRFFYALHAIPCIGFEITYKTGKRIAFSGDTFYDPVGLENMCPKIISQARRDALMKFPWDADLVLHEAGVPPIHTPLESLAKLPDQYKKNIRLLHIDGKKSAEAQLLGFQIAQLGVTNSIILEASPLLLANFDGELEYKDLPPMSLLRLFGSVDLLKGVALSDLLELCQMCTYRKYKIGEVIIASTTTTTTTTIVEENEKDPVTSLIIVAVGEVASIRNGTTVTLGYADYFNEHKCIYGKSLTNLQVVASTEIVETVHIPRPVVNGLIATNPDLSRKLRNVANWRGDDNFVAIEYNSVLRNMTYAQRTQLQSVCVLKSCKKGEKLFRQGDACRYAYLICDGYFILDEIHGTRLLEPGSTTTSTIGSGIAGKKFSNASTNTVTDSDFFFPQKKSTSSTADMFIKKSSTGNAMDFFSSTATATTTTNNNNTNTNNTTTAAKKKSSVNLDKDGSMIASAISVPKKGSASSAPPPVSKKFSGESTDIAGTSVSTTTITRERRDSTGKISIISGLGRKLFGFGKKSSIGNPDSAQSSMNGGDEGIEEDMILQDIPLDHIGRGTFICDLLGIQYELPHTVTLTCASQTATVFMIDKDHASEFLNDNPLALLSLLKSMLII